MNPLEFLKKAQMMKKGKKVVPIHEGTSIEENEVVKNKKNTKGKIKGKK